MEKIKFKKPAKSRFAERPTGHPQNRSPDDDPSYVRLEDMAKTATSEIEPEGLHRSLASQEYDENVQKLDIWVKDKMMLKRDQNNAKKANTLAL
jgi:hypothetical protein